MVISKKAIELLREKGIQRAKKATAAEGLTGAGVNGNVAAGN